MTVRMRVFHARLPVGRGWLWACSDTTTHGSRNGDDWPGWLSPFTTADVAADVARRHWRSWHGPLCRHCHTPTVHRIDIPGGAHAYTCNCRKTVMVGAA